MNIARYRQWPGQNPLHSEFRQLLDRFFDSGLADQRDTDDSSVVTSQWVPQVDVREENDRFVLFADLPGIDPNDIELSMDKGILTIKGERSSETSEQTERFSRIERRYGTFHRRFALPDSADPEGIQARGRHGVLEITIPKRPQMAPRRIQVDRYEGDDRAVKGPATPQ